MNENTNLNKFNTNIEHQNTKIEIEPKRRMHRKTKIETT
jgi:hypothetical protein